LDISPKTYRRWLKRPHVPDKRKGPLSAPSHKLSDLERQKVLEIANSKAYGALPPTQIIPKLADKGLYIASESSMYRILKEEKMLLHRDKSKQRVPYRRPTSCTATSPNQVWSWDISYLKSSVNGQFYYLYFIMDIYSRKIVGYKVHEEQTAEHAAALAIEACTKEKINRGQIKLHSDNGSPMKGSTMLVTLQKLGVIPSFSRPAVSNDNPFSEALFKTLKYCPQYPSKPFENLEATSKWIDKFVVWYNTSHLHSGIKFLTPQARHEGTDANIIINRQNVYEAAKKANPNRWSKNTRNWVLPKEVLLNPGNLNALDAEKMLAK